MIGCFLRWVECDGYLEPEPIERYDGWASLLGAYERDFFAPIEDEL